MTLYNLPNSTAGLDSILIQIIQEVPSLMIGMNLFVYFFVFLSGMALQKLSSGNSDAPMWSTLGAVLTVFLNLILSLGTGIVNPIALGVSLAVALFSGLWLFLSSGRFE